MTFFFLFGPSIYGEKLQDFLFRLPHLSFRPRKKRKENIIIFTLSLSLSLARARDRALGSVLYTIYRSRCSLSQS